MNCIDLYSGIGGWTLGMKLSGINHIRSFEWNKDSNRTHNLNFGTDTKEVDIRQLDFRTLPEVGSIDFIVGSPPCTQFSYSNKGGGGNIQDGLIDMYQFLSVVEYLQPRYWAMENVPRVRNILKKVLDEDPKFQRFRELFNYLNVVDSSEYGLPQKRKRMIAGRFPHELFESYKHLTPEINLGDILISLNDEIVEDPVYGYTLPLSEITDHQIEVPLNFEELRLNRESKEYHPVYNNMAFPEVLARPSRTITSTCTRVSRESLIVRNGEDYRRLTIRERGLLMGFPITYQFYGGTYSSKLKMIGNAIPPVVTYYLFQSMLEVQPENLRLINEVNDYEHLRPTEPIPATNPEIPKFKYRDNRSFRLAVPSYRFGSGVRFELSNNVNKTFCKWSIKFFYGSSKKIIQVPFTPERFGRIIQLLKKQNIEIEDKLTPIKDLAASLTSRNLQNKWTHKANECIHPYEVLDLFSEFAIEIKLSLEELDLSDTEFSSIVGENLNKKLFNNKSLVLSGIIAGYIFNENLPE